MGRIYTRLSRYIKESIDIFEIEIVKDPGGNTYSVNYQHNDVEITGKLRSYHSGRAEQFKFEVDSFLDKDTEEYYDKNWKAIEDRILDKFSSRS